MRKRALLFPTVIRAGAGPHDLGPGGHDDEEAVRIMFLSNSDSSGSDSNSDSDSDSASNPDSWDSDHRRRLGRIDDHIIIHEASSTWPTTYTHPLPETKGKFIYRARPGVPLCVVKGEPDALDEGEEEGCIRVSPILHF